MKKFFILLFSAVAFAGKAQNLQSLDTVKAPANYENIYTRSLYSDSLASSFIIFIKKEVKDHKHITHSEHVYVLEGEGDMRVGEKKMNVKKGNMIFIPKGIVHSLKVTSTTAVKVLSVQSPMFDGKDRVMTK